MRAIAIVFILIGALSKLYSSNQTELQMPCPFGQACISWRKETVKAPIRQNGQWHNVYGVLLPVRETTAGKHG